MATPFQLRFARVAQQQYDKYHLIRESQSPLREQIKRYWTETGFAFPGVGEAWSAVFVSWCAKEAGAQPEDFPFAKRHSKFIYKFIQNAKSGAGRFRAHDVATYSPKVGDILHNNREGNLYTYAYAEQNADYASHTAVVIEVGADGRGLYLRTIGGNESDSVGMKEVRLSSKGRVLNPQGLYISVVETLL